MKTTIILLAALSAASPAGAMTKASTMHYLKAQLLEKQGDFPQALQEYRAAIALDPQSPYLLEAAVELSLETGGTGAAVELAERLAKLDDKSTKAWFLLGNARWARGDGAGAQKAFEEALRLNPKYSEAMLSLGNLLGAQSPAKARQYFERYLEANPANAAEAHYQIALVAEKEGRLDDSVLHFKAALEVNGESMQTRYALAQVYEMRRDTDAALGQYQEILRRDPTNVALLDQVGEIYFVKSDPAQAQIYFLRAKSAANNNPQACLWLAIIAEQRGDFNAAAKALSESAALKDEASLSLRLSYYLTQAGRLKEAVAALEAAHAKWPANEDVAYFLALGYDDLKAPDKAVSLLGEVVRAKPDFRDARFQLGALYEKSGRIADAEREFLALIELRPTDSPALNYLGYSLADRGLKLPEAEALIRRAVAQDPANGAYRDSLGWAFFKQGRSREALSELREAVKLMPDDSTIWEHQGDVYEVLGDTSAAWDAWKRADGAAAPSDKLAKKLAAAEAAFGEGELGERYMALARRLHGDIRSYGGVCEVAGSVLGREFSFNALLAYKAPGELSLDILGPLFVPMLRVRLGGRDAFEMDPIKLQGVPPEAVQDAVYQTFRVLRDYLGGALYAGRPSVYHNGWRSRWVVTPAGQFFLGDRRQTFKSFQSAGPSPLTLSLDEFQERQDHRVPAYLKLEGKGFSLSFRLPSIAVDFEEPAPR